VSAPSPLANDSTLASIHAMLNPRSMMRNPVMFLVEVGTVLTAIVTVQSIVGGAATGLIVYQAALTFLLLVTVLFANFAEALAEARGKAQADSLRATRQDTPAFLLDSVGSETGHFVPSTKLRTGDHVMVEAGQVIPADGEVVGGVASVDESAITGESAPVIREAGGDRSGVTGGTRVLSDRIIVQVTSEPGQSFLDRMIALVEGAIRQKTPNEIALTIVLAAFSLIFLIVTTALYPMARYFGEPPDIPTLIALLVCLIPTTIGALLAAIGIAGMDRALMANIIAKSGKAVELAGDIDTLLLDKTGTITIGNRRATQFVPLGGVSDRQLARLAGLASMADSTPEGKSILDLARPVCGGLDDVTAAELDVDVRQLPLFRRRQHGVLLRRLLLIPERYRREVVLALLMPADLPIRRLIAVDPTLMLDLESQRLVEHDRINEMPAIHAHLLPDPPVREDRHAEVGEAALAESPRFAEVILGARAPDGRLFGAVDIELLVALAEPLRTARARR
jgi:K+-transporting ATPase B subunit